MSEPAATTPFAAPAMIFINLPVADVTVATRFYEALGARRNPQFSDATTSCIVLSDVIHVMLLEHDRFAQFSTRGIPDAQATAQVLLAISVAERAAVDAGIDAAIAAGGSADPGPVQDHGFMYGRSVADPDGHIWEITWMDLAQVPSRPDAAPTDAEQPATAYEGASP